jgi:hypothetical protein
MRAPTQGRDRLSVLSAAKRLFDGSILRDTSACLVQDKPLADDLLRTILLMHMPTVQTLCMCVSFPVL